MMDEYYLVDCGLACVVDLGLRGVLIRRAGWEISTLVERISCWNVGRKRTRSY